MSADLEASPSTVGEGGARLWLYPDRRGGVFANRRKTIAIALITFYLIAPYLTVGGEPFVRFNVLAARVSLFGYSFRYTDASFVFFAFALLALTLFFVTAVRGRIWCGYACPQTVFIDWVIRPIEELVEGNALQRRKRDQGPWNVDKFVRKFIKQTLFLIISAVVANTFLAYFIPPSTLLHWMTQLPSEHPVAFTLMFLVLIAFYFDLGWFREQFCCFLCPYARFQSVLTDWFTPVVGYDAKRGEPRGKTSESGACIDCKLCVRVCPTGIDIRRGLQLECIACERCMDACDSVMEHLDRPKGLIRIASQAEFAGEPAQASSPWRRPRVLIYAALITVVLASFTIALINRHDVSLTLVRQPGQSFSRIDAGRVSNIFQVHVENNRGEAVPLKFDLIEPAGGEIICGICQQQLAAYGSQRVNLVVVFPAVGGEGRPTQNAKIRFPATGQTLETPLISP